MQKGLAKLDRQQDCSIWFAFSLRRSILKQSHGVLSEVESLWLSASQGHTPVSQRVVLCCGTFKNGPFYTNEARLDTRKRLKVSAKKTEDMFLKDDFLFSIRNSLDRVSGNTSEFHRTLPSIRRLQRQTRMAENSLKISVFFRIFVERIRKTS